MLIHSLSSLDLDLHLFNGLLWEQFSVWGSTCFTSVTLISVWQCLCTSQSTQDRMELRTHSKKQCLAIFKPVQYPPI